MPLRKQTPPLQQWMKSCRLLSVSWAKKAHLTQTKKHRPWAWPLATSALYSVLLLNAYIDYNEEAETAPAFVSDNPTKITDRGLV